MNGILKKLKLKVSSACVYVCMYVHVHMPRITYEGQRTTRRSCFSPSTVWAPGIELRSSVVASAFSHLVQPDWFKPPACLESFKLELNFGNTVFPCNYQKRMSNLYWRKRALSCKPRLLDMLQGINCSCEEEHPAKLSGTSGNMEWEQKQALATGLPRLDWITREGKAATLATTGKLSYKMSVHRAKIQRETETEKPQGWTNRFSKLKSHRR